jgi:hypothetical protein
MNKLFWHQNHTHSIVRETKKKTPRFCSRTTKLWKVFKVNLPGKKNYWINVCRRLWPFSLCNAENLTIKILQSLCVSHKIVETYRNQHAPSSQKENWEWCANDSTDQSHLRIWHLLRTGQNIGKAPLAFDRMWISAL